ncbi:MAG: polyamine aminopropyltransferase [Cytophagales bacterium]|nr:polyamine aminopropyltransferase [Armatimonadota bacterium]
MTALSPPAESAAPAPVAPAPAEAPLTQQERTEALTLLASVFLVAACGLIYELLLSTISSYLLGSSVTQFSLCIGAFIGAMGLGSYVSQYVRRNLLRLFLSIEIALSVIGGVSAWALMGAYTFLGEGGYYTALFGTLALLGGLTGLELPLLTRLLSRYGALRTTIAHALSFDYVGALLGSVAFPLLLLPHLGSTRTAFLVGLLNLGVAAFCIWVFRLRLRATLRPLALCGILGALLLTGTVFADRVSGLFERRLYEDEILYTRQTPYQRIVITRFRDDLRLFLDGNLQFSSADEYRYHEALVHPAMLLSASAERVLVLGGGDGLAVREILKHSGVRDVTLVDIDPAMTRLAQTYPALVRQNRDSLSDRRVHILHEDAYKFLERGTERFGVIVADLPDPNNEGLAKLYSREFYRLLHRRLGRGGVLVTQATSPLFARDAFWCVAATAESAGFTTAPYHTYIPTFGDWGFVLARPKGEQAASLADLQVPAALPLRFLSSASVAALTAFDADSSRVSSAVSTLDFPRILRYYERGARKWE